MTHVRVWVKTSSQRPVFTSSSKRFLSLPSISSPETRNRESVTADGGAGENRPACTLHYFHYLCTHLVLFCTMLPFTKDQSDCRIFLGEFYWITTVQFESKPKVKSKSKFVLCQLMCSTVYTSTVLLLVLGVGGWSHFYYISP